MHRASRLEWHEPDYVWNGFSDTGQNYASEAAQTNNDMLELPTTRTTRFHVFPCALSPNAFLRDIATLFHNTELGAA